MNTPADTAPPTYDPHKVDWDEFRHAEREWLRAGADILHASIGTDLYFQAHPDHASDRRRGESWDRQAAEAHAWRARRPRPEQYPTGR